MMFKLFITTACLILATVVHAEESNKEASAQPEVKQPPNNLGKWTPPPEVVMPSIDEIVSDVVEDTEKAQFTPEQIDKLKKLYLEKQQAKALPYVSPPKPIIRTLPVSLEPGVTPPVIRLAQGQNTSVVFSDASGDPWNIESIVMNRKNFSDGRKDGEDSKTTPTNLMTVEPLSPAAYGNAVVKLRGLSTPVIFILTAGQDEVDLRVDAKIPGGNPDSVSMVQMSNIPSIDNKLTMFLDGVPPNEAIRYSVIGFPGAEAWLYENNLYLRIMAEAQYPAYLAAAKSTSGVAVYRFFNMHNQITVISGGKAYTLAIEKGVR